MAAPKGNKYWEKRFKYGREKKYASPDELWEDFMKYAKWVAKTPWMKSDAIKSGDYAGQIIEIPTARPITVTGMCLYLGIDFQTFKNYEEKEGYEDYFDVCTRIQRTIKDYKLEGAIVGAFNANIIARDLGLMDKQDITSGGKEIKNVIQFGGKDVEI